MARRELTFRILAAVALGCHAFFHGVWIAALVLNWLAPSLMDC